MARTDQGVMASKRTGGIGETVKTIVYAVLIAFAVRTFAYEPFNIPSGSMKPTLLEGDYLFVSKFSYGYSWYSLVPFGAPLFQGRILDRAPQRGDVVVFKLPRDTSQDYIKRVIGLPGDRIQVRESRLYINDQLVPEERVDDYRTVEDGQLVAIPRFVETLPSSAPGGGGVKHYILDRSPRGPLDNTQVYEVPPGHYFMMGDNRDNSIDSRVLDRVGFVPEENLVGRAEFLWFSLEGCSFWQVWCWPTHLRFERMFTGIH